MVIDNRIRPLGLRLFSRGSLHSFYSANNILLRGFEKNYQFQSKDNLTNRRCDEPAILETVAKKTLSCQSQPLKTDHIPFEVRSKKKSTLPVSLKKQMDAYLALTKPKLTVLVMLSSICSYALSPNSVSVVELLFLTAGTSLASGSANAINQAREPEFDRLMTRTATRPVVSGIITPTQAYKFAALTGSLGVSTLWFGVNPIVGSLGALNIILYAWIYTSLKRKSIINTWVGAVVGAIPPLMGWAASSSLYDPGAWCLAGLLYAWQFPHFNALSHNIRNEYKRANYVMTAYENPQLNARVGFRYSLLMFPLCFGLAYFHVTDYYFLLDSSILNGWLAFEAGRFWWQQRSNLHSEMANVLAKKMFWGSVWHLPGILILAMLHKKRQDQFE